MLTMAAVVGSPTRLYGDDVVVAHNGYRFDFPILERMSAPLGGYRFTTYDTLVLARELHPGSRKLHDLAVRFGVDTGHEHRALDDSRALARVFLRLDAERVTRSRKTALANLLDQLGIALALWSAPDESAEAKMLRQAAAIYALGQLTQADRIAVIAYDDQIDVLHPSATVTPQMVEVASQRIRQLSARGTTDLSGGWLTGCREIADHLDGEQIARCLLLTDGLANRGITDQDALATHAAELRARGIVTSTFGIGGFKEMLVGLFLVAFALILRELPRADDGRIALIAALGALGAASVAAYSYPALAWLAGTAGLWALGELALAYRHGRMDEVREGIRKAAPMLLVGLGVLIVLAIAELPRIQDFINSDTVSTVTNTDSKLRFPVPLPEALGVWPSGEWLFGYGDLGLDAWQVFAAVGLIAFGFALWWWLRRGDVALPAAVAAALIVYLWSIFGAGLYVEAKALQVPAALIMLFILGALLLPTLERRRGAGPAEAEPEAGPPGSATGGIGWRAAIAIPFVVLAAYSSFLALRDSVIAPSDRFDELEAFRAETAGQPVLDLTSDRYFDYYLRGAEVRSPAKNAEDKFRGRQGKNQRLPVDFDSVYARDMDLFTYAVTTDADYQSGAPPNWEEVDRTDSYVLWKRTGPTPFVGVLAEEAVDPEDGGLPDVERLLSGRGARAPTAACATGKR